jgi:serine/threonine protein kinase/tetratricopeptide (TPR) repeat protein
MRNPQPIAESTLISGRYRIEREVGRGGMAVVYRAHDTRHDRPVALKFLHPEIAAALGTDRFFQEIRLAARLNHPHIVALYDSGEVDGTLYYVMPFIEGPNLRSRLESEGRLPADEAIDLAQQIASALDYAHRLGVVHRDIKPENVMLYEGEALVADFGIAKAVSAAGGSNLTLTGIAIGTPAYMSPEQAAGETELDGRSDEYSLACVLYEMLTGEPPFTASTPQALIAKRFTDTPRSVSAIVPAIPEYVSQAVRRALSRDAKERFATAADLSSALEPKQRAARSAEKPSIAVLPFTNMSTDPENEFFSDGIAEEIINALTKVQALEVVSRTSAFAFKGKNLDMREIGRQLGVKTLLEGSVRKAGNRLRVTAQVIDVETGYHLWSERFDREMADVFAIQDEIAENIVKALRVVLSKREEGAIKAARTSNVRAYEYYLRGRQLYHQWRRESLEGADDMFRRAIALDPDYALAYTGLADSSAFRYMYASGAEEALQQADAASRRAVELDPTLAEAHAARGLTLSCQKRLEEADEELRRAMELDPTLYEAPYYYARMLQMQGRLAEAVGYYERAALLREDDFQAAGLAQVIYRSLGRSEDMKRAAERCVEAAKRAIAVNPGDSRALQMGALALQSLGEGTTSREWADRAIEVDPNEISTHYNVACLFSVAGDHERALDLLNRAVDLGWSRPEWLRQDPDFAALRENPLFQRLLSRLEGPAEGKPE